MSFYSGRKHCNLVIFIIIVSTLEQTAFAYPIVNSMSLQNPTNEVLNHLEVTSELSDAKQNIDYSERRKRHIIGGAGYGGFAGGFGGGFGGISAPIYATPIVHSVPIVNYVPVITSVPVVHTIPSFGSGYSGYGGYGGYGGYSGYEGHGGYDGYEGYGGYSGYEGHGGYGGYEEHSGYGGYGGPGAIGGVGFGKFSQSYHTHDFGIGGGFIG